MIYPDDDDVLSFPSEIGGWKLGIDKAKSLFQDVKDIAKNHRDGGRLIFELMEDGAECELLSVRGGGWRKGKLKLRVQLEFVPDNPEAFMKVVEPNSPLDDLRSNLDI